MLWYLNLRLGDGLQERGLAMTILKNLTQTQPFIFRV